MTRAVNLHVVSTSPSSPCAISPGTEGLYAATGDFEPKLFPNFSAPIQTDEPSPIDGVPSNVQSLALSIDALRSWQGVSLVAPSGDIDMLMLPSDAACPLVGGVVGFDPEMVFAAVSPRTMIASGATTNSLEPSFTVDLETGRIAQLPTGSTIGTPRVSAATVSLGDGSAMVIGGISSGIARNSAEIFDESTGAFESSTIQLQEARAHHGATLLANGDVLVAGGSNAGGLTATTERIHFNGTDWHSAEGTTPVLSRARNDPFVLRLADGKVLVAGGTDASGPVDLLEIFSADATTSTATPFHARAREAYVALEGGGALYVAAPDASDPPDFPRAWFIASSGVATAVTPDVTAPLTDVKLFPRGGGGAVLWTGSSWVRFDPFGGMQSMSPAPTTGPDPTSPIAWADPGSRAWVAPDGTVQMWRDDVRNAFATDDTYLTADSMTKNLAPDTFGLKPFDPIGGLLLEPDQTVYVADARYLDFTAEVDSIGEDDSPPFVVLRSEGSEIAVGDVDGCVYPPSAKGPTHVFVERIGAAVFYSLGGMYFTPCATIAPAARVAVGIRGGGAGSHALHFSVARSDAALH